ncbi:MAG: hypothetical protein Kow0098_07700 [Ignavibacteriaceae bacterium]
MLILWVNSCNTEQPGITNPGSTSFTAIPIIDMQPGEYYKGEDGGLYGNYENEPPEEHLINGLNEISEITALDTNGLQDESGKIGFIAIGMSNTSQEFRVFQELVNQGNEISSNLVLVDGAQGGITAENWAQEVSPWNVLSERISKANLVAKQVQIAWINLTTKEPTQDFWTESNKLKNYLKDVLNNAKGSYPNLKIAFFSSRIYGGYSKDLISPEPYAYETGYSVRWLIQDQINEDSLLNYDSSKGTVYSPIIFWGPYLWANGVNPRSDGLSWLISDFESDGRHPSSSGEFKVANLLLTFFKANELTKVWFLE